MIAFSPGGELAVLRCQGGPLPKELSGFKYAGGHAIRLLCTGKSLPTCATRRQEICLPFPTSMILTHSRSPVHPSSAGSSLFLSLSPFRTFVHVHHDFSCTLAFLANRIPPYSLLNVTCSSNSSQDLAPQLSTAPILRLRWRTLTTYPPKDQKSPSCGPLVREGTTRTSFTRWRRKSRVALTAKMTVWATLAR